MVSCAWYPAPEVGEIAAEVIEAHHEHLADADIRYCFRTQPEKVRNKIALATVRRVTGLNAYLTDGASWVDRLNPITLKPVVDVLTGEVAQDPVPPRPFFLVSVFDFGWHALEPSAKVALIDHELCHIQEVGEDGDLGLIGHDLEEFHAVVRRHGAWEPAIRLIVQAYEDSRIGQARLDVETADSRKGAA